MMPFRFVLVRFGSHFWSIFGPFWGHLGDFGGVSRDIRKKLPKNVEKNTFQAPSWGLLGPKLEQLGAKMAAKSAKIGQHDRQDGHFGINLAASGSIWGAFWSHLGKQAENQKTLKNLRFLLVFWGFGGSWRAVLEQLGAMLGYVGPSWRHLGATWRQNVSQERQHEPTWRPRAPTWADIAQKTRKRAKNINLAWHKNGKRVWM